MPLFGDFITAYENNRRNKYTSYTERIFSQISAQLSKQIEDISFGVITLTHLLSYMKPMVVFS